MTAAILGIVVLFTYGHAIFGPLIDKFSDWRDGS